MRGDLPGVSVVSLIQTSRALDHERLYMMTFWQTVVVSYVAVRFDHANHK